VGNLVGKEADQRYDLQLSFTIQSKDPSFLGMTRLDTFRLVGSPIARSSRLKADNL